MKKLAILAALMVASFSVLADKATVSLNNFDQNGGAGVPIYFQTSGTLAPVGANIFVQILGGASGTSLAPVTDSAGNALKIAMGTGGAGAGNFDAGAGLVPGVAAGATATFQLQAWQGTGGFAGATVKFQSANWTQATGSWNENPLTPVSGPTLQIPGTSIILTTGGPPIPEPSTLALGLLGGLALLIRRRGK